MYTYQLSSERQSIDYYTDEDTSSPEQIRDFSDASIWKARLSLMLSLIRNQKNATIVDFDDISVKLFAKDAEEIVPLGAWALIPSSSKWKSPFHWDWEAEATFLEKHGLYRAGDKELLAIEQAYRQVRSTEEAKAKNEELKKRLAIFIEKHSNVLEEYAVELGILYFLLNDYANAFKFLILFPSPSLEDITYEVAFQLAYFGPNSDIEYMKKYEDLYGTERPFLS